MSEGGSLHRERGVIGAGSFDKWLNLKGNVLRLQFRTFTVIYRRELTCSYPELKVFTLAPSQTYRVLLIRGGLRGGPKNGPPSKKRASTWTPD